MRYGIVVFLCFTLQIFASPLKNQREDQCGYNACTQLDPDALNVHLIAHSHDDVGWLKTVDQYYYGSRSNIQLAGVQYIIDSVVRALLANPERKFIQVESAFFYKWWHEQTQTKKNQVLGLIQNGQLEIVGGAWSMNDEAAAHYHSIIDGFTLGLQFLKDTFGECARPKIGWQIDPFGHTREMASIFAGLGYDALFFARLDWRDKRARLDSRTGEMLWRSSANLGEKSNLFTHVMYNHYSPPTGFFFDVLSNDDPLIPDRDSSEYNLDEKVEEFTDYVNNQSQRYITNNIMIAMGNDFTYQDANFNYKNLDILIKAYRDSEQQDSLGRRINLLYSTPACYLKAVNDHATESEFTFKVKTDDFIPYASDYHTYWSGYYTSRPTQKRFERQSNNLLQINKQVASFAGERASSLNENLFDLRAAMGIMQHHDAITGTEKEHVADDYAKIVMKALAKSQTNINEMIPHLLFKNKESQVQLHFDPCLLANVSHCEPTQKQEFVVAVYNPLSRRVSHHVRLPVNSDSFVITDGANEVIKYQLTPTITNFSYIPDITPSKFDLVFLAENLPPLGAKVYYIDNEGFGKPPQDIVPDESSDRFDLGDENNWASLNPNTGFLINAGIQKIGVSVGQQLMYYIGARGNNSAFENRASGAYIFRPDPENGNARTFTDNLLDNLKVYKGDLVDEAHQTFSDWSKQIIRVYKNGETYVEFDWLVGPIDVDDNQSKEVISRFSSNLMSDDFYTDSNGREMLTRRNNFRETWNYSDEEPVAGNYYPITTTISLADQQGYREMAVLTDRSQGGASLESGQLELMVHRRLLDDDAFGVGEALNEVEFNNETGLTVRGQHYLTLGSTRQESTAGYSRTRMRDIVQRKILAPGVFVADATDLELEDIKQQFNAEFAGLTRDLPSAVQILTLEPWGDNAVLLRLEHILEISEGGKQVIVNLEDLFSLFTVTSLEEMTLGANQVLGENQRLQWKEGGCLSESDDCLANNFEYSRKNRAITDFEIELEPMQIRTYIATIEYI